MIQNTMDPGFLGVYFFPHLYDCVQIKERIETI